MRRLRLPIITLDRRVGRQAARDLTAGRLRFMNALGWAMDARVLLGLGLVSRLTSATWGQKQRADTFIRVFMGTTVLHHAIKHVVAQRRPDRLDHGLHRGRPFQQTGRADDAFPSGHAMHAGAWASLQSRSLSAGVAPLAWILGAVAGAARIGLLAHWPTGVVAGFTLGVVWERLLHAVSKTRSR